MPPAPMIGGQEQTGGIGGKRARDILQQVEIIEGRKRCTSLGYSVLAGTGEKELDVNKC